MYNEIVMIDRIPEIPSGYSWVACPELNAGFLSPNGWFGAVMPDVWGNPVVFVSPKEAINLEDLGTCLIATRTDIPLEIPFNAVREARTSLVDLGNAEPVGDIKAKKVGSFMVFKREVEGPDNPAAGGLPTHFWLQTAANPNTGTIFKFIFRTPEIYASQDAKIANTILARVILARVI